MEDKKILKNFVQAVFYTSESSCSHQLIPPLMQTEPPEDESVINSKGDIIVALKYVPSDSSLKFSKKRKGTLMVKITEAKNLPVPKGTSLPDPYCKG